VVFTFSRAIIGFGAAAVIRAARTPAQRAAAAAAAILCVALMAALTFTKVSLDPSHPLDARIETAHESVRNQELRASLETLSEHPAYGTGPGSLPGEAAGYGRRQAHNTPVGVAATLGLPALAVLIALLVALWRGRSRPTNWATWGGLAGLGIDGLGQDIEHFRHVWVMLGVAGAQQGDRPVASCRGDASRSKA
jgi:O-antigen ligase